jgi:hypothetical protein
LARFARSGRGSIELGNNLRKFVLVGRHLLKYDAEMMSTDKRR